MKNRLFIALISILYAGNLFSQSIWLKDFDYHTADSIANYYSGKDKVFKTTRELADTLTANLNTEHEKFRVLYKWVCNNLSYNYSAKGYDAKRALKTRKAVCAGYSDLLHDLCYHADLQCKTINGYAKTRKTDLDIEFTTVNHAWNAVKLYDRWYLVDATWSAGYMDDKSNRFTRQFNDYYFFTDSINFNRQHFPDTASMYFQRREQYIHLPEFNLQPFYYAAFFEHGMSHEYPTTKNVSYTCNDEFCFSFSSKEDIVDFQARIEPKNTNFPQQLTFPYTVETDGKGNYFLHGKFEYEGQYYLTIYINGWGTIVYRLSVGDI